MCVPTSDLSRQRPRPPPPPPIGLALATLLLVGGTACPTEKKDTVVAPGEEAATAPEEAPREAPPAELPDDPVFTWYDARGRPHLASSIEEVPVAFRGQVVVSQLGGGAKLALAEEVTVGDYRQATPTYSTVDLTSLASEESQEFDASLDHEKIYVYSAEWCGFCKKVKAFFTEKLIAYVERDIEKDAGAAAELAAKAKATGLGARGIPVTDIHGKLIVGFNPKELTKRLEEVGEELLPPPPSRGTEVE